MAGPARRSPVRAVPAPSGRIVCAFCFLPGDVQISKLGERCSICSAELVELYRWPAFPGVVVPVTAGADVDARVRAGR